MDENENCPNCGGCGEVTIILPNGDLEAAGCGLCKGFGEVIHDDGLTEMTVENIILYVKAEIKRLENQIDTWSLLSDEVEEVEIIITTLKDLVTWIEKEAE